MALFFTVDGAGVESADLEPLRGDGAGVCFLERLGGDNPASNSNLSVS